MNKNTRPGNNDRNLTPRANANVKSVGFSVCEKLQTSLAGRVGFSFNSRRPPMGDEELRLNNLLLACVFFPKKTEAWLAGKSFEQIEKIKEAK